MNNSQFKLQMPIKHPKLGRKLWNIANGIYPKKKPILGEEDPIVRLEEAESNLSPELLKQVLSKDDLIQLNNTLQLRRDKNYPLYGGGVLTDSKVPTRDNVTNF